MKKVTHWDRAPIAMWDEQDELKLAFPDGFARLQSGRLEYTTRAEVSGAAHTGSPFGRPDGSSGQLPALDDGSIALPRAADLCGNLWSLSSDTRSCHLLPADRPEAWMEIPLPSGLWKHLIVDHAGFVWIAGAGGLRRFAPRQNPPQWQTPGGTAAATAVTALSLSPDGLALAALETGDLIELDIDAEEETLERYLGTVPDPVHTMHTDTRGTVWIATNHGLYCQSDFAAPSHAAWQQQPGRLPGGGNHDIFSVPCGGRLYMAGGLLRFWGYPTSQHCFGELFGYDPRSGHWQIVDEMPFPRRYNGIAELEQRVWLVGGEGELQGPGRDVTVLDTVDIYDPETATWSSGPALNQPRTDPFVMASDGRVWAAGGSGDSTNRLQSMESIGAGERAWRKEPDLPSPAREGGCCALGGVLYCASLDGFFAYDIGAAAWDRSIPQPGTLVKGPLMTAFRGEVWMMGGAGQDQTQCYDPRIRAWREGPRLPTQQSWGAAAVLDGQLIITGGAHRSDRHDMTIYDDRTWVLR
ncbi:MAG: hypothetical protein HN712_15740 [Gemmatimonadetes bacterium]|jgi:hypothetical protein|nr:hypothetical protein [Gemmatimonadota bacterium]MBT6145173.1 hypothetical protein [Gemmatimonadota bacterium]MBT7861773.1 hypothetical protein [Gemmatimonadota bacterium]